MFTRGCSTAWRPNSDAKGIYIRVKQSIAMDDDGGWGVNGIDGSKGSENKTKPELTRGPFYNILSPTVRNSLKHAWGVMSLARKHWAASLNTGGGDKVCPAKVYGRNAEMSQQEFLILGRSGHVTAKLPEKERRGRKEG